MACSGKDSAMRAISLVVALSLMVVSGVGAQESLPPSAPASTVVYEAPYIAPPAADSASPRMWGRAEYLLWWIKDGPAPVPLVTANNTGGFPVLGIAGTNVIYGGSPIDFNTFSGGRFTVGSWIDNDETLGIEANLFFLGQRSSRFFAGSDGTG